MAARSHSRSSRSTRALRQGSRGGQAALPGFEFRKKFAFGGSAKRGNPKTARPVVTHQSLHITMRSTLARGQASFLYQAREVEKILRRQAEIFGIRLYDFANAGNHLHLLLKTPSRRALQGFLRAVGGLLPRLVLGCEKGAPWKTKEESKFWDARPHSRVVAWGKDYKGVKNYLEMNRLEIKGYDRLTARDLLAEVRHLAEVSRLRAFGFA